MHSRNYASDDFILLEKWFTSYPTGDWECPPEDCLPKDTGLVVENEGVPICAGFLYFTNANICALEFLICDYTVEKNIKKEAISLLIDNLVEMAKKNSYKYIFSSTNNAGLSYRFKKAGFLKSDLVYNYIKVL